METVVMLPEAFERLTVIVERLNKRLEKKGVQKIRLENVHSVFKRLKDAVSGKSFTYEFLEFDINGQLPKVEGYSFVAFCDHSEKMIITESDIDIERFRDRQVCDHCKSKRKRSKTYILQNDETGELVQIGSSCLKSFVGFGSDALEKAVAALSDIRNFLNDHCGVQNETFVSGGVSLGSPMFPVEEVIDKANRIIEDMGFVPTGNPCSTKELLSGWCFYNETIMKYQFPENYNFEAPLEPVSSKVREFVMGSSEDNNFQRNCRQIFENGYVSSKYFGYVAAMVQGWRKHLLEEEKKVEEKKEFSWVPVSTKLETTAVLKDVKSFDGFYGTTFLYVFEDDEHCLVWFTSKDLDVEKGKTYTVRGTVKENKTYNDVKQTVITRAKVL